MSKVSVSAQPAKPPVDDKQATLDLLKKLEDEYRQFFRKPEKVADFWAAMRFELDVGKFDLAALHLKLLLEKQPPDEVDKELLKIEEAQGLFAFLRLQSIRKWSDHPPFQKEAVKNVDTLINRVTNALEKHLGDPKRINKFIKQLDAATVEERAFAFAQLNRSKARAVPYLIQALADGGPLYEKIVSAMLRLDRDIVPAFLEVLKARNPKDAADPDLRMTLLDIIKRRGDRRAVPYLWHLSRSSQYPVQVRARAKATLAYLLEADAESLPPAKMALAELAEKYFQHQVKFVDAKRVKVWPWNGKTLATEPVTLTTAQAEEFFGLRYAREALELGPAYLPAQMAFLNLTLDRGFAPELDQAFLKKMPAGLQQLLATIDSDLLTAALDRALNEGNVRIILATVQALGERGEVRAARQSSGGPPRGIVKALYYPDRRVQFAAARAMLRMPATPVPVASQRVVEILRRLLAAQTEPKVLVVHTPAVKAFAVRKTVKEAGFDPVLAATIQEAMVQMSQAADVDAILLYVPAQATDLPYVLSELRQDRDSGLLPLLLFAGKKDEERLEKMARRYRNVWVVPEVVATLPDELKATLEKTIKDAAGAKLSAKERHEFARVSVDYLWRMAREEIRGYDVRPAVKAVEKALLSKDQAVEAIEILGRLPGTANQQRLALLVLDEAQGKLRLTAAQELNRHIQRHGVVLDNQHIKGLKATYRMTPDADLRSQLALVMGSLRPTAGQTGKRLIEFQPK